MSKRKILLMAFHPLFHKSRVNRAMFDQVKEMEGITARHMYEIYPDFHIDVGREQELLLEHDLILLQHPFYWYSSPSLLKEWMDLVLEYGFAYGSRGTALEGKCIVHALSTGGQGHSYQGKDRTGYTVRQLLAPFEQSFSLCRMHFLAPFVVHGTHRLDTEQIAHEVANYRRAIDYLQDTGNDLNKLERTSYLNDLISTGSKH